MMKASNNQPTPGLSLEDNLRGARWSDKFYLAVIGAASDKCAISPNDPAARLLAERMGVAALLADDTGRLANWTADMPSVALNHLMSGREPWSKAAQSLLAQFEDMRPLELSPTELREGATELRKQAAALIQLAEDCETSAAEQGS